MSILFFFLGVLGVASFLLALPPALKEKSVQRFFAALVVTFLAVVLPLFVFLLSSAMAPEWKGACLHGWLDCFITAKLALAPIAVFASAALYATDVLRVEQRTKRWIVAGVFMGAVLSIVCLVFGLTCIKIEAFLWLFMLVPLYTAVWYSVRAVQLIKESGTGLNTGVSALAGTLPLWIGSALWSYSAYTSLPNQQPGCFIVTAAGRGHRKLVGPHFEIQHNGRPVEANRQLVTLWQLEDLWRTSAPRSHKYFRYFYNRIGPVIAARIRSPWLADLTYLAIKPVEFAARVLISKPRDFRIATSRHAGGHQIGESFGLHESGGGPHALQDAGALAVARQNGAP